LGAFNIYHIQRKLFTISITFFLLSISFTHNISAESIFDEDRELPIIDRFVQLVTSIFFPIIQVFAAAPTAKPEKIEIGYTESVSLDVGLMSLEEPGKWEVDPGFSFLTGREISFEAEFPQGNPGGMWQVNFDPPIIVAEEGTLIKSNATIRLNAPPDLTTPIKSGLIRIKMTDTWAVKNLWWPEGPDYSLFTKAGWLFAAITTGFGQYSGKVLPEVFYIDVLANVKPFHSVHIEATNPILKIRPRQINSVPFRVTNMGNYNDTFLFKIHSNSTEIDLVDPGFITLKPGESDYVLMGVSATPNFRDIGTLHPIVIDVFSQDQENVSIASQTFVIETQGIYVSEFGIIYSGIGFIFLMFFALIFLFYRRRRTSKICEKPDKPWTIPEEKEHLDQLKKEDKKKYYNTLQMMEEEYQSSLLWYKSYYQAMSKQKKEKSQNGLAKIKNNNIFNKSETKKKEKPVIKEQKVEVEKKEIKKKEIKEKPKKDIIKIDSIKKYYERKKLAQIEKVKRDRSIIRVMREQEKQKKKVNF